MLWSHSCNFFWNQNFFISKKKIQVLADPVVVNFFEMHLIQQNEMKKIPFQKNTSVGFNWCFDPILVIFFEMIFFPFQKKLQVLDQVHFKKIYNDWISQHLYFFFAFLKKITTTGSSHFLSPNEQGFYQCEFKTWNLLLNWGVLSSEPCSLVKAECLQQKGKVAAL